MADVRKTFVVREDAFSDAGRALSRPVRKVVAAAVLTNPYAGRGFVEDLGELIGQGARIANMLADLALSEMQNPVESYGKGGIAGERGEIEHIAAILHPEFGEPVRQRLSGVSILPSVKKRGPMGASLDIPIHHVRAMRVRSHMDSAELSVPDAPAADELLVALAVSDGPRPHPRVGGLSQEEVIGRDGLH